MYLIENNTSIVTNFPVLGFKNLVFCTSRIYKLSILSHVANQINVIIQKVMLCEVNITQVTFDICNSTENDLIPGYGDGYIKIKHEHLVTLIEISISLYPLSKKLAIHHIHPVSDFPEKLIIIHGELQSLIRNILHINRRFTLEE